MKNCKKIVSLLLAVLMIIAMVPLGTMSIIAEGNVEAISTPNVAKVGNTEYATIDEAIAAWTNNTTLTLLSDVTLTDVIMLSSTEYHILDLGTYTMTAATGKDAIQYVINGRSNASYALDIKADAANPGGITATGKTIVSHIKPSSGAPSKDRPITRFYGGVFNASYVVKQGSTSSWGFLTSGYTGASAPYFQFYGGVYNGTIYTNRSQNQFHGGTFNGNLQMSVDSSAYTLISGGTFAKLSNEMRSALNSDKFTIGSSKGVYDKEVYIDDNGNYVVAAAEPAQGIEAAVAITPGTNDYLAYSKVGTEQVLKYTDAKLALEKNNTTSSKITVYTEELDMTGINFAGTIVAPAGHTLTIYNAPEGLKTEGNVIIVKTVAQIGTQGYASLKAAIDAAQDGDTIKLIGDILLDDIKNVEARPAASNGNGKYCGFNYGNGAFFNVIDKDLTVDLNGHTITYDIHDDEWCNKRVVSLFYATDKSNLTITDSSEAKTGAVTVYGMATAVYSVAVDTKVTIKGGTWTWNKCKTCEATNAFLYASHGGELYVEGGKFVNNVEGESGEYMFFSHYSSKETTENSAGVDYDQTKIAVSGGTFVNCNPGEIKYMDQGDGNKETVDNGCAEGYKPEKNDDGTYGVVVDPAYGKVAKIGDSYYTTLAAAITDATAGDTITLLADITENVTINENVTIDGAGFTYTGNININNADVTVLNVKFEKGYIYHSNDGDLIVKDCSFANGGYAITTSRIDSVTVENCTINNQSLLYAKLSTPEIIIKNTTIDSGNYIIHLVYGTKAYLENVTATNMTGYGICTQNYGAKTITLKNCSIDAPKYYALAVRDDRTTAADTFIFEGANTMSSLYVSQYAKYQLSEGATLKAPAGYTVTTDVADSTVEYANGVYSVALFVAKIGDTGYTTVETALAAAKSGDTVTLIKDVNNAGYVLVTPGVTLDLNGKSLKANYLVAFTGAHVVDNALDENNKATKSGRLIIAKNNVVLDLKNAQTPIYDAANGCYVFITVRFGSETKPRYGFEDWKYNVSPLFGESLTAAGIAHNLLLNGYKDSGVKVVIRVSWIKDGEYEATQDFAFLDEHVFEIISGFNTTKVNNYADMFEATFDADDITSATSVAISTVILTDTGAEFEGGKVIVENTPDETPEN